MVSELADKILTARDKLGVKEGVLFVVYIPNLLTNKPDAFKLWLVDQAAPVYRTSNEQSIKLDLADAEIHYV
jgi:hypothetical protein